MQHHRLLVAVIAATALGAPLAGCGAMKKAAEEGTHLVLFAATDDTEVTVDGKQTTVSAGKFKSLAVGPGKHEIVVGDRTMSIELEAFDRYAVPLEKDQCFFSINVGLSHYSAGGGESLGKVDLEQRRTESAPFKFPPSHYLTESELPEQRSGSERTLLLRSLPCGEVDRLEGGGASDPSPPDRVVPTDPVSARFVGAAECEAAEGLTLAWCKAGQAWAGATTTRLPPEGTLVGISLELSNERTLAEAIAAEPRPSFLAVTHGDAPAAWLTTINGENPDEVAAMNDFAKSVQAILAGTGTELDLSGELASYLAGLPEGAQTALVNGETELSIGDARLRKHGEYWLAYEPRDAGGLYFSVLMPMKLGENETE